MCEGSGDFDTENAYRKPTVTSAYNESLDLEDSDQLQGRDFF